MLACIPGQTRKELLFDLHRISFWQKKYNIFSAIYCLYSLAIYQDLYAELKKNRVKISPGKSEFNSTSGAKVRVSDMLEFTYPSFGGYGILAGGKEAAGITSYSDGLERLKRLTDKSGLNHKDADFIAHINNFLFETQLLYAKQLCPVVNAKVKKKLLELYSRKIAELKFSLYRKQCRQG